MKKGEQIICLLGCLIGWIGLIIQIGLVFNNRTEPPYFIAFRLASFFTIVGGFSCTLFFSSKLFKSNRKSNSKPRILSSYNVTVYALIVLIGYHVLLQDIWNPQGWQYVADRILHFTLPILTIAYGLLYSKLESSYWNTISNLLILPVVYFIYVLIFGTITWQYPYPFFNVNVMGYSTVLIFATIVLIAILVTASIFYLLKFITRKRKLYNSLPK